MNKSKPAAKIGRKPTIDDVAAMSGVARVTVSRVLNGGANVREEVRRKVLRSVEALDYRVNVQARTLAGGGSRLFTLVHPAADGSEPNSYWESALELGALHACTQHGFHLLTRRVTKDFWHSRDWVLDLVETHRSEGIVLTPPFSDDLELREFISDRGCALVCIAPGRDGRRSVSSIGIDDELAGYEITKYLIGLGHARFAFIGGLEGHFAAEQRWDGVMRALEEAGLGCRAVKAVRGDFSFKSGVDLAPDLLNGRQAPTALICSNDDMAVGALFAAHRMGVSVPEELSITGFDDTPISALIWPPLTTVHQPIKDMGFRAVELITEQLKLVRPGATNGFEQLPHEVVVRQSAGAPRASRRREAK